ncbi:MAG TPA: DUF5317 domain-containing protein [Thermomicrobiales bacterium]|nr:hypothetical protein [Chloroflexota bacterium]HBY44637.1 hypothetical protein [Chloroflexota bacterium]HCG28319.1 hypothetical protein [Chloroflexota bacterium]HQZ89371.1 DUF5317 domain-containing protein [Thermomicrobiales bacterium]HRA30820.1 DUF5317 domain-containing protein [Thermomicrobiales bacterium]
MVLLVAILLALVAGYLTGGSLAHANQARFRALPLFVGAAVVQVLIFTPLLGARDFIHEYGSLIYIASVLASLGAILLNLHIPGMKIMAAGAALNALVIIANGGYMPSTEAALARAGKLEAVERSEAQAPGDDWLLTNSTIADDDTRLLFLGDVIAIPEGVPLANVISIGDLLLALGAALAVLRVMHLPAEAAATNSEGG